MVFLTSIEIVGVCFSGVLLLCLVTSCAAALRIRFLRKNGYHDRLNLASKGVQPDTPPGQKALPYFERDLDENFASHPEASTMYRSSVLRGIDGLLLDIAQLGSCMGVAFFSFLAPIMGVVIVVASVMFVLRALWGGVYWVLSVVGGFLWSLLRVIAHAFCQGCRRVCIDAQCHHLYSTSYCTAFCYSRACSPVCRICMRPWCEKLVEEGAWEVVLMRARDSNGRLPMPIKEDWVAARRSRVGRGGVQQQKGVDHSPLTASPVPTSPSILTPTLNDRDGFVGSTVSIGGGRSGESKPLPPPAGSRRFLEDQGANAQRNAGSNPACGGAGTPASPVLIPSSPRRRPKRMGGRLAYDGDEEEHPALSMSSLAFAAIRAAWLGEYLRPSAPPREGRVRRVVQSDGTVVEEEEVSDDEEEGGGGGERGREKRGGAQ